MPFTHALPGSVGQVVETQVEILLQYNVSGSPQDPPCWFARVGDRSPKTRGKQLTAGLIGRLCATCFPRHFTEPQVVSVEAKCVPCARS